MLYLSVFHPHQGDSPLHPQASGGLPLPLVEPAYFFINDNGGGLQRSHMWTPQPHAASLVISILHISRNKSEHINNIKHWQILSTNAHNSHWVSLLVIYFEKNCVHLCGTNLLRVILLPWEILCVLLIPFNDESLMPVHFLHSLSFPNAWI